MLPGMNVGVGESDDVAAMVGVTKDVGVGEGESLPPQAMVVAKIKTAVAIATRIN